MDDELGVVKLRHAPSTSLESFLVLYEYKRVAVVVHGSMYSTSTNGLLLWYMAVCTSGLKVLTRVNETNGYSDYDVVAFIVTTMENAVVLYEVRTSAGGAC